MLNLEIARNINPLRTLWVCYGATWRHKRTHLDFLTCKNIAMIKTNAIFYELTLSESIFITLTESVVRKKRERLNNPALHFAKCSFIYNNLILFLMCVPNKHVPMTMLALFPKTHNNMDIHEWLISLLPQNTVLQEDTPLLTKPRKISTFPKNILLLTSFIASLWKSLISVNTA